MSTRGSNAVVLGASMSGLLAARVLAEHYRTVTVIERDVLPDDPENRRGVPQGRQPHVLLARCAQILEELFPGILDELVAGGAPVWNDGDLSKLWGSFGGHRLVRSAALADPRALQYYYPSRPFLEWHVRQRVRALANVSIIESHDVLGLTSTPDRSRVTGARIVRRADRSETILNADLVIDATGRGSRTPVFLDELGYERPAEDELMVHLTYVSQLVRIPAETLHEKAIAIFPEPGRPTVFALFPNENDSALVLVGTLGGVEPPTCRDELLDVAATFAPAHAVAVARAAEPLAVVAQHRIPSNRWRRYDKMPSTPKGLLVVGDAICSFNPIYGQGMTVAAIEALVLRDCLRSAGCDLPKRFFRASAKKIRVAWQTAVGSDLALPEVQGPRPLSMRITNAYVDKVLAAAEGDPVVAQQFLRFIGMADAPTRLLRPSLMLRIARAAWRRKSMTREHATGSRACRNIPAPVRVIRAGAPDFGASDASAVPSRVALARMPGRSEPASCSD
jgi:2-polyprenyl-6-methoxyphenol hydroxylase-like FAD-dependent oxidoreductase